MNDDKLVILVAEDDAGHFTLVKKNLWRCCVDSEIMHFKDGKEILDFLFRRAQGPKMKPSQSYLLLLDIKMPEVDGIEVLRQIKADHELSKIPVIMLTTTDDPAEASVCHKLGCNFYIVKPANYNDFVELMQRLGTFLCMSGMRVPAIAQADEVGSAAKTQ